jgi:hypothetical protein
MLATIAGADHGTNWLISSRRPRTTPARAAKVTERLWEFDNIVDVLEVLGGHESAGIMTKDEREIINSLFKELIDAESKEFPGSGRCNAPDRRGVYVIYSPQGRVLHVGRTPSGQGGIAQRLGNHMTRASSFWEKYLVPNGINLREGGYTFRCLVVEDARQRALLEYYAIGCLCPEHIGLSRGNVAPPQSK